MRTVGLKILKNKLSEYVRLAANGETVQVTDRGRVVAELKPPQGEPVEHPTDPLADLKRRGLIRPATIVGKGPPPQAPGPKMTLEELLKDLDEARADRDLP